MDLITSVSLFDGYLFWVVCMALCIPAIILRLFEKPCKYYPLLISCAVIACIYPAVELYQLIGFIAWQMMLIYGYRQIRARKLCTRAHTVIAVISVLLSLLPIIITRITESFVPTWSFGFLGISYITFRTVQIILDLYDQLPQTIRPLDLLLFLIYFPTISSGPIDRSERFFADVRAVMPRQEYLELLSEGMLRILLGLVYKSVCAFICFKVLKYCENYSDLYGYLAYLYIYGFYLFFDFAGYSLMAIGVGNLFGVRIPINFKLPFLARDIKDFWDRWHISLSTWFRDYVFTRIVMLLFRKKIVKNRLHTAVIGYCSTMGLMGLWHGLTASYICYGLYHGILLSLNEVYQKRSAFHKKYRSNIVYIWFSRAITLQLVLIGFFIFSGKGVDLIQQIWRLFS